MHKYDFICICICNHYISVDMTTQHMFVASEIFVDSLLWPATIKVS